MSISKDENKPWYEQMVDILFKADISDKEFASLSKEMEQFIALVESSAVERTRKEDAKVARSNKCDERKVGHYGDIIADSYNDKVVANEVCEDIATAIEALNK